MLFLYSTVLYCTVKDLLVWIIFTLPFITGSLGSSKMYHCSASMISCSLLLLYEISSTGTFFFFYIGTKAKQQHTVICKLYVRIVLVCVRTQVMGLLLGAWGDGSREGNTVMIDHAMILTR